MKFFLWCEGQDKRRTNKQSKQGSTGVSKHQMRDDQIDTTVSELKKNMAILTLLSNYVYGPA